MYIYIYTSYNIYACLNHNFNDHTIHFVGLPTEIYLDVCHVCQHHVQPMVWNTGPNAPDVTSNAGFLRQI